MGCGGSKEEENPNKIKSEFKWIGILRFDDFFRTCEGVLSKAETLRAGIEDSRDEGVEIAGTWALKDGKYIDTAQVLFWAISANNEGQIKNSQLEIVDQAPYVTLDASHLNRSTHDLFTTLETYLKTVAAGPLTIKDLVEKIQDLVKKVQDLVKEGKDEIKNSNLSFKGKADAVMNLTKNANQLKNEVPKCTRLAGIIDTAVADMKELIPKFKELFNTADETGLKAHQANLTTPAEIFAKFHTGPRDAKAKDPKQQKEAAAKKKKEKKPKKEEKKEGEKKEGEKKEGEKTEGEKKE